MLYNLYYCAIIIVMSCRSKCFLTFFTVYQVNRLYPFLCTYWELLNYNFSRCPLLLPFWCFASQQNSNSRLFICWQTFLSERWIWLANGSHLLCCIYSKHLVCFIRACHLLRGIYMNMNIGQVILWSHSHWSPELSSALVHLLHFQKRLLHA